MSRGALVAWWQALADRERRLLVLGTTVVVAVAVYLTLWEPAALGIRKLQSDLPQLRAQDAAMRSMADEAGRLRAAGGNAASIAPADRVAAVRRSLQRAGLWRERSAAEVSAKSAGGDDTTTVSTLTVSGAVTTVASTASSRLEPPEVIAEGSDRVRVRFDNIDYGVWVGWLASTESELAMRAARVTVVALAPKGPVGHVKAEALLDWTQDKPAAAAPATSRP